MWKEFIRKRGITKVSKELGVSRQTIYCWLNGTTRVRDKDKKKLVELSNNAFGIMNFFTKDDE